MITILTYLKNYDLDNDFNYETITFYEFFKRNYFGRSTYVR